MKHFYKHGSRLLLIMLCCVLLSGCDFPEFLKGNTDKTATEESINTAPEEKSEHYGKAVKDAQEYHDVVVSKEEAQAYMDEVKKEKGWFKYLWWTIFSEDAHEMSRAVKMNATKESWSYYTSKRSMKKLKETGTEEEIADVQKIKDSIEEDSSIAQGAAKERASKDITTDKIKKWVLIGLVLLAVIFVLFLIGFLRSGAYALRTPNYAYYAPPIPQPQQVQTPVVMNHTQYIRTPEYRAVESFCLQNGFDPETFIRESGGVHEAYMRTR